MLEQCMQGARHGFAVATFVTLAAAGVTAAADWPQWRGPGRDGVAPGIRLPERWPAKLAELWRVEVGAGYSGPVVAGDRVVVLARQGEEEVVLCLAAEGGRRPRPYPQWGTSVSPLVEGEQVIVAIGTEGEGGLAGLNRETGDVAWKLTADGPGYGSPVVAELAGRRQIVALLEKSLAGAAPGTGTLLWQVPYRVPYEQNALTPVIGGGLVFVSGYRMEAAAYRIAADGGRLAAEKAWGNSDAPIFLSTPVIHGKHLFGLSQRSRGTLVCLSLEDGKTVWSSPPGWGEYVSIVRAGDRSLVLTTAGELVVVAAGPAGYRELGRSPVTERPVWAHLAVAGSRLFVKDARDLICLRLPRS